MSKNKVTLEVEFQGFSSPNNLTARLGVKVPKSGEDKRVGISVQTADELLCGARADVLLKLGGDQMPLPGIEHEPLASVADIKHYSCDPKWIKFTLVFNAEDVDIKKLLLFTKEKGQLTIQRVGDAGEDDESDGAESSS